MRPASSLTAETAQLPVSVFLMRYNYFQNQMLYTRTYKHRINSSRFLYTSILFKGYIQVEYFNINQVIGFIGWLMLTEPDSTFFSLTCDAKKKTSSRSPYAIYLFP